MKIAIDYDGTITRDLRLFDNFIRMAQQFGHEVFCVTMRYDTTAERIADILPCEIIYTGRKAKMKFMSEKGHSDVHIWIDDMPHLLFQGAE